MEPIVSIAMSQVDWDKIALESTTAEKVVSFLGIKVQVSDLVPEGLAIFNGKDGVISVQKLYDM